MSNLQKVLTVEKLIEMGFTEEKDGTGDPRGTDWNIRSDKFHLMVNAWCDVTLSRINPNTDSVKLQIDDLSDLQSAIDFIQD